MSTTNQQKSSNPILDGFPPDYENPRKIPKAKFIENLDEYIKKEGGNVDDILRRLQEELSKYTLSEIKLRQNRDVLQKKIPEINKSLQAVKFLKQEQEEDKDIKTNFQLSDNVYVEATLDKTKTVALWLGANVMVEYSFDEATELLNKSLNTTTTHLDNILEDLAFLKDQITTTEVNVSRVHNHRVKLRMQAKQKPNLSK